jgi:malto-oligosyltrehalose synthase
MTATYRIQFHARFRVPDLIDILDYLQELGIDTIYGSPILTANPGSTHGYDVTDPGRLNPEVTDEEEWEWLHRELRQRGMEYMQDIVPNHTALSPHNVWFKTVVGRGPEGCYATHFDIDWSHPRLPGRTILPVLGDTPERVAAAGELDYYQGGLRVYQNYWEAEGANRNAEVEKSPYVVPVHWQATTDFITYRRFFTVNELIGMRTEDERVYADLHARTFADIEAGRIDHLRLDHVDGLLDPTGYLKRLRESVGEDVGLYVEKILEPGEQLPDEWPVQGTTGYDFLAAVNRLLTNEENSVSFSDLYEQLTDAPLPDYHEMVFRNKLMLVKEHFTGELDNLVRRWLPLLPGRLKKGFGERLAHWLAAFPVYRIYPDGGRLTPAELLHCVEAAETVLHYVPQRGRAVLRWVGWLAERNFSGGMLEALQRSMQLSGPLMAKGVEDTTFYQFWRQAHLNEVGSSADPTERLSVRDFHRFVSGRKASSMNATATHDTKRGEDGRAFLQALSFHHREWQTFVELVSERLNLREIRPAGLYLVLQSLVAGYPLHKPAEQAKLTERLHAYLEKALREGKEMSNWAEPNVAYERGLNRLADQILENDELRTALEELLRTIWPQTRHNSFAQLILKCTVPGIPDVYQGTESWDLSFVDPDNRRPVNYDKRRSWLQREPENDYDPAGKARLLRTLLQLRRGHPDFFAGADYRPIAIGDETLAFKRSFGSKELAVRIAKRAGTQVPSPTGDDWQRVVTADYGGGLGVWFRG